MFSLKVVYILFCWHELFVGMHVLLSVQWNEDDELCRLIESLSIFLTGKQPFVHV